MSLKTQSRALFERLSQREKLLISVFLVTALLIWASLTLRGMSRIIRELGITGADLQEQAFVLSQQDDINRRMEVALRNLDTEKTFTASQLVGKIDEIARATDGLAYEIFTPRTENDAEFNLHSLRIRFRRASLGELISFNEALRQEEPYITLENLRITANKSNPAELDALFVLSSFELKNNSLESL